VLKILGRVTSINVRKVLWLADEIGVEYQREDWGMPLRDPNVAEFRALNPNAQVPVLIEDDFVLWESTAIMAYLAAAHGPTPLQPADSRAKALSDQWLGWQGSDLSSVWGYAVMALARKVPGYDDETRIGESLKRWTPKMGILEAQLGKTGAYVTGETMTMADIALGLAVHRWFSVDRDLAPMPNCRAYLERLRQGEGGKYLTAETP
jgi:glutathione S-transferase